MTAIRTPKRRLYTAISNAIANDSRLSFEARGLMLYLLARPCDWKIRFADIETEGGIKRKKRERIVDELRSYGYIESRLIAGADGRFEYEHSICENPIWKAPTVGRKDTTVKPPTVGRKDTTVKPPTVGRKDTLYKSLSNNTLEENLTIQEKDKEIYVENREKAIAENQLEKVSTVAEQARQVFLFWQKELGHEKAKFTADRKGKIVARLNEGYSVDDLRTAILGCKSSSFHLGDNDSGTRFDDLTLICRSGSKVENFIDRYAKSITKGKVQNNGQTKSATTSLGGDRGRDREALAALGIVE